MTRRNVFVPLCVALLVIQFTVPRLGRSPAWVPFCLLAGYSAGRWFVSRGGK